MNSVLILAGGIGERAGAIIPKQFIEVNNKSLIIYTLEKFQNCDEIDEINVVCVEGWKNKLRDEAKKNKITKLNNICIGGCTGLESVKKGLDMLSYLNDEDLILIHDSVRPFVDNKSILNNIEVAQKYGLAVSAIDCCETLIYSEDGYSSNKIINRDHLYRVLTPQTFKYRLLRDLYDEIDIKKVSEPSTFALYMKTGKKIYYSKGNEKNFKITYPSDLEYFKKMLN